MPVFEYQAINAAGKRIKGELDAESPRRLKENLKARGIFVTNYVEGSKAKLSTGTGLKREVNFGQLAQGRITTMMLAMLTRQLSTLQHAGVPLLESLNAVVEQTSHPGLRYVLSDVRARVNEGSSLANALREHPKVFSELYVNMVRAGESSGNLDLVLDKLTDYLDNQADLRGKIISALFYPIIMMILGVGVITFLFIYVIPKVTQIFADQQQALPLLTRALIAFTNFVSSAWILLLIGLVVAGIMVFRRWVRTESGRYRWDCFKLTIPIYGLTVRMIAVARFASTLGTLLASGVPLLNAMAIVKEILGNQRLIEVVEHVRSNVREGDSIAAPLKRSGEFPPIVCHMIAIGERTGKLETMLDNVAISYNKQVENRLSAMTSLMEPLMIIMMGIVVGFIVFAVLVPIMQIGQGFT